MLLEFIPLLIPLFMLFKPFVFNPLLKPLKPFKLAFNPFKLVFKPPVFTPLPLGIVKLVPIVVGVLGTSCKFCPMFILPVILVVFKAVLLRSILQLVPLF